MALSAAQKYELRRQSRQRSYQKRRLDYLEGKGTAVRESTPNSPSQPREPSRYLTALIKFEPHRRAAIELMFRADKLTARLDFAEMLEPLIGMASTERQRYVYKTAEPNEQNCCQVGGKHVTKLRPTFARNSLNPLGICMNSGTAE
ncbi:hypothetical protein BU25DRAFT_453727 [Macroventuria anomochaeta]|uniref:Uncharacterized protein n=1 Tax=Macroventuria anomochaeta TaxID=301207 RepID=A0ACB6SDW8_9PLEO|nr:uncharacterized protein BU25DRAFT_453727 [Macroventuria anomochaeta]KAF2632511.1 hypothetical protein BU25DRAFT_453727 [Macroventuria anomochaeta]